MLQFSTLIQYVERRDTVFIPDNFLLFLVSDMYSIYYPLTSNKKEGKTKHAGPDKYSSVFYQHAKQGFKFWETDDLKEKQTAWSR